MTGNMGFLIRKWILRAILVGAIGVPFGQHAFGLDLDWRQVSSGMKHAVEAIDKASGGWMDTVSAATIQAPGDGQVEVAFSPNEGAEGLIIKVIRSAQSRIDVMAYAFTSAPITRALIDAQKRGVQVRLVADDKQNLAGGDSKGRAALSALSNAGAKVYVTSEFAIHHDKVILVDGKHLQTGSFNYSASAQTRNSENVIVLWNNAGAVHAFEGHFERNLRGAKTFRPY